MASAKTGVVLGNIRQFATTGAGNAIVEEPHDDGEILRKLDEIDKKLPTPEDALAERIATLVFDKIKKAEPKPKAEPKEPKPKAEPKAPKITFKKIVPKAEKKEKIVPSEDPPFYVLETPGQKAFGEYSQYLAEKYSPAIAQPKIDDMAEDSAAFSFAVKSVIKLEESIKRFEAEPAAQFGQWMTNMFLSIMDESLGMITNSIKEELSALSFTSQSKAKEKEAKAKAKKDGTTIEKNEIEDSIKKEVEKRIDEQIFGRGNSAIEAISAVLAGCVANFKLDYVGNARTAIAELFAMGGAKWKNKYAQLKHVWEKNREYLNSEEFKKEREANHIKEIQEMQKGEERVMDRREVLKEEYDLFVNHPPFVPENTAGVVQAYAIYKDSFTSLSKAKLYVESIGGKFQGKYAQTYPKLYIIHQFEIPVGEHPTKKFVELPDKKGFKVLV